MPLIRQWAPQEGSATAVWRIEEDEDFFLQRLSAGPHILQRLDRIRAAKRRLEFLAGRFLLRLLVPGFPLGLIQPDIYDKPRLPGDVVRFSISHSFPYAAAVVSRSRECGIDIQRPHPRIGLLADKFLSAVEKSRIPETAENLLLAWCIKEAAYKWQGRRSVDFIGHLPIVRLQHVGSECIAGVELCITGVTVSLEVQGWQEEEYALALALG